MIRPKERPSPLSFFSERTPSSTSPINVGAVTGLCDGTGEEVDTSATVDGANDSVGVADGAGVGAGVGTIVGNGDDGIGVGEEVGEMVGIGVGIVVGTGVGAGDGAKVLTATPETSAELMSKRRATILNAMSPVAKPTSAAVKHLFPQIVEFVESSSIVKT